MWAQIVFSGDYYIYLERSWSEDHFLQKYAKYCTESYHNADLQHFFQYYTVATNENGVFLSHDNRLGLGPAKMKEGDLVVTLSGSPVPFIVREKTLPEERRLLSALSGSRMDRSMS